MYVYKHTHAYLKSDLTKNYFKLNSFGLVFF